MNSIIRPIITEKSMTDAGKGRYTFIVDKDSSKVEIRRAVEKAFGVNVKKVDTNIIRGSVVRMTKKGKSQKQFEFKKARVVLAKGQKIDIFEEKKEKKS